MPSTIKSLTDPRGDLTLYCKDIVNNSIPKDKLYSTVDASVVPNAGGFTIDSTNPAVVSFTRLDQFRIIRKITVTIDISAPSAGSATLLIENLDDNLPLGYAIEGPLGRTWGGNIFKRQLTTGTADRTTSSAQLDVEGTLAGDVTLVFEDIFFKA